MPTKTAPRAYSPPGKDNDVLDNYFQNDVFDDDPFASPPPNAGNKDNNKRKQPEGLGIDEEILVKKRAIVPRIKLDETLLVYSFSVHGMQTHSLSGCSLQMGYRSCAREPGISD